MTIGRLTGYEPGQLAREGGESVNCPYCSVEETMNGKPKSRVYCSPQRNLSTLTATRQPRDGIRCMCDE